MRRQTIKELRKKKLAQRNEKKYAKKMPKKWGIKSDTLWEKMKRLGYHLDKSGFCYGIASVGIHAVLINQPNNFDRDLYFLRRLKKNKNRGQATARSFCDAVIFNQQPNQYSFLYPSENVSVRQQDIIKTLPMMMSPILEAEGGPVEIARAAGVYKVKELELLFSMMRCAIEKNPHPVGFLLEDVVHAIAIYFHLVYQKWCCVDLRKLPTHTYLSDSHLARSVSQTFSPQLRMTTMSMRIIVSKNNEALSKKTFGDLFATSEWNNLHAPVVEKKPYFMQWLYIAASMGLEHIVNALLLLGVDPDRPVIKEQAYETPLIAASRFGHAHIVNALIKHGATIDLRPKENPHCALFYAKMYGHHHVARLLTANHATLNLSEISELRQ